jgi:hypothetical protein
MGTKVSAPTPRNYGQETQDTLEAQINLAPQLFAAESQYAPKYQDLQLKLMDEAMPRLMDMYSQAAPQLSAIDASNTRAQREADIAAVRDLGPQALDAMKISNPELAKLLGSMTGQAQAGLDAGSRMTSEQLEQSQQGSRAAWAARGLGSSPASALDEVVQSQAAGASEQDRRRGFAMQAANMQQSAYGNPFQAILERPVGSAAMMSTLGGQSMALNPGRLFQPESQYAADLIGGNKQQQLAARTASAANRSALAGAMIGSVGEAASSM